MFTCRSGIRDHGAIKVSSADFLTRDNEFLTLCDSEFVQSDNLEHSLLTVGQDTWTDGWLGMRRLLSVVVNAPKMWLAVSPLKLKHTSLLLCTSSFQGDSTCNGTHTKKALLSDPQLFEDQFDELVTELTKRDLNDPVLADALNRLREVCLPDVLCLVLCVVCQAELLSHVIFLCTSLW